MVTSSHLTCLGDAHTSDIVVALVAGKSQKSMPRESEIDTRTAASSVPEAVGGRSAAARAASKQARCKESPVGRRRDGADDGGRRKKRAAAGEEEAVMGTSKSVRRAAR